jgi:hypothetical protein
MLRLAYLGPADNHGTLSLKIETGRCLLKSVEHDPYKDSTWSGDPAPEEHNERVSRGMIALG